VGAWGVGEGARPGRVGERVKLGDRLAGAMVHGTVRRRTARCGLDAGSVTARGPQVRVHRVHLVSDRRPLAPVGIVVMCMTQAVVVAVVVGHTGCAEGERTRGGGTDHRSVHMRDIRGPPSISQALQIAYECVERGSVRQMHTCVTTRKYPPKCHV
jgi:hypothetical protein